MALPPSKLEIQRRIEQVYDDIQEIAELEVEKVDGSAPVQNSRALAVRARFVDDMMTLLQTVMPPSA